MKIANPQKVRKAIKEYYKQADLWLPTMEDGETIDSHRIYRIQALNQEGRTHFYRLRDRITSTEKLRKHLIKHTPINVYFSVSSWLNPTKTSYKTYKKEGDGRRHIDKNGFLYSDFAVDCDHRNREEIERIYNFFLSHGIPEDDLQIRFSGNGYHVIVKQWYRNKNIENPIKREQDAYREMQSYARLLINKGFDFDYIVQNDSINSPSADTRRITKLPNTFTKYGNKSEIVDIENLYSFTPETIYPDIEITSKKVDLRHTRNRDQWVINLG